MEVFFEVLPAGVVLVLASCGVHGEFGRAGYEPRFEHEGQCAVELYRLEFGGAGSAKGFGVGTMSGHAVVEAGSAGSEAFRFGVVLSEDKAHELVHEIAVKPGRAEGVLGDDPAWGKDGEVDVGGAGQLAGRGEDGVDGWVGVVEGDGVDAVEASERIFAGSIVAVPGDDVEWGVIEVGGPEVPEEFSYYLESSAVAVFVGGMRSEEVAGVGEAIGSDGSQFWQAKGGAVVFEEVASRMRVEQDDAKFYAAGNDGDLAGCDIKNAELGVEGETA